MTVEESPSQTAAGVSLRRYRLTELGEKYYDHWEEPRVRSSRGFCYGFRTVIQVLNISAISDWGCAKTRSVEYLYRYGGFPEWVEHPAIQQNFPDRLSKVDERVVRHGILSLIKGDEWVAGSYDPIHSNCASIG